MELSKETSLYPKDSIKNLVGRYITYISGEGIKVHNADDLTDYIQINSTETSMWRASNKMMSLDDSALKFFSNTDATHPLVSYGSSTIFYKPGTDTAAATINSTGINIAAGSITLGSNFSVTAAGNLTAKSATLGAWVLNSSDLYYISAAPGYSDDSVLLSPNGTTNSNSIGGSSGYNTWKITVGRQFGVTSNGTLYANNAHISGEITATSGTIGGCTIDSNGHLIVPSAYINGTLTVDTITGGTQGSQNYIYLSKNQIGSSVTVGGKSWSDWMIIVGSKFGVDSYGNLVATNVDLSGTIAATNGTIGAANATNKIQIGTNSTNASIYYGMNSLTSTANGFYIGTDGISVGGGKFKVTNTGEITATSGTIGGCTIDSNGKLQIPVAQINGSLTISQITYDSDNKVTIDSSDGMVIYKGGVPVAQYGSEFKTKYPIQFGSSAGETFKITNVVKKIALNHGKTKRYTQTLTLANYYPLGIVGWDFSGTGMSILTMHECFLSSRSVGSATAYFHLRNNGKTTNCTTTGSTPTTIRLKVLWVYCGTGFNITDTDGATETDTSTGDDEDE